MNTSNPSITRAIIALLAALLTTHAAAQLSGQPVRAASKKFTESVILGELIAQLARDAGADATHDAELGGSGVLFQSLQQDAIDAYPEYTGTLTQELLAGDDTTTPRALRAALARRGLGMSAPLGFSNNYAIAVRPDTAQELGLRTISDLRDQPELRFGFNHEFLERTDGWRGMRERYGLPQADPVGLDHDLAYRALVAGEIDAMEVYTTEARIEQLGLVTLEDDLGYFPDYAAVIVHRLDLPEREPGAFASIRRLEGAIDEDAMRAMNARAEIDNAREPEIADRFLRERFGIEPPSRDANPIDTALGEVAGVRVGEILRHTLDHLKLSVIALLAGVTAGVPLGVLAAKRSHEGAVVLGVAGIIQTIPSLALLALMIPLLKKIGDPPALAALFLYSLLPIIRGVHTGLTGVPKSLIESADALGLSPARRLTLIELPLASPSILAGIKTAAVMIVGFATLGALIGAGGLGVPILSGIRRNDTAMILAGAIPAAGLAVITQLGFALIDRTLVPKGLRNG